jgi:hypothetical protein
MTNKDDETVEMTRFRCNVQLGNGPDQRGDVTVEMVREPNDDRNERHVIVPEAVTDEASTMNVEAPCNDADFAEFYHELERASTALRDVLGLDDDGGEQ